MNHPLCITWILSLASSLTIFIRFNFYFFPTFDGRFSFIVTSLENIIFCKNKISRLIFRFPNIRWANLKILNENYSQNHQNTQLKLDFYLVSKWSPKIWCWKSYFHSCWKVLIKVGKNHEENYLFFWLQFELFSFIPRIGPSKIKLSNFSIFKPTSTLYKLPLTHYMTIPMFHFLKFSILSKKLNLKSSILKV